MCTIARSKYPVQDSHEHKRILHPHACARAVERTAAMCSVANESDSTLGISIGRMVRHVEYGPFEHLIWQLVRKFTNCWTPFLQCWYQFCFVYLQRSFVMIRPRVRILHEEEDI